MKKNTLSILILIIAVLVIISVFVSFNSESSRSGDESTGQVLIPSLYDQLNEITKLEIINSSGKVVIEKSESSNSLWVVKSKDNYPADVSQIRNTIIALAELQKVESKTKKEKNYKKLGVEALSNGKVAIGSQSAHIKLSAKENKLASIIIGNKKSGHTSSANGIKTLNYVRVEENKQVWLVAGNLNLPSNKSFINSTITNIPDSRVQKVTIKQSKGSKIIISKKSKTDSNFILEGLKKNKELNNPGILKSIASTLAGLNFDDVTLKSSDKKFSDIVKVKFVLFNGLTIKLNIVIKDNLYYLWLNASSSAPVSIASLKQEDIESKNATPDAKQEAKQLNTLSQWLYIIPSDKAELITKKLKNLVKTKQKK